MEQGGKSEEINYSSMISKILMQLHEDRRNNYDEAYIAGMDGFVNLTAIHHDTECNKELDGIIIELARRLDSKEGRDNQREGKPRPGARERISVQMADKKEMAVLRCLKRNRIMDFSIKKE